MCTKAKKYLQVAQASSKIYKLVKVTAGVVEITSGVVNAFLKLAELDDTQYGKALSNIFIILELASMVGEITGAMQLGLSKNAKVKNIANAPKIMSEAMQGVQKSIAGIAGTGKKALQATTSFIETITAMLKEGTAALLKRIQLYFAKLKDKVIEQFIKIVLIKGGKEVTLNFIVIDPISLSAKIIYEGSKLTKEIVLSLLAKYTGLKFLDEVVESGEKIYVILYKSKKLGEEVRLDSGDIKKVRAFLEKLKSKDSAKYLDELAEITLKRRAALAKHLNKFNVYLKNYISGDVASSPIKLGFKELILLPEKGSPVGGQGGHWLNKFLEVKKVTKPTGVSSLEKIANDIPFEAEVIIKSLLGEKFPKKALSSMFPKNWSYKRVQEEIAWVYENTIAKDKGLIETNNGISSFEGLSTSGFKIKIQIKDSKVINAHPKID